MKVLLLDADGVVLEKGELFSEQYAREYNVPLESVVSFFKGPFGACQEGVKDLKEEIAPYLEQWGWEGDVDSFLRYWFQDVKLASGVEERIAECHNKGIQVYLASNNEVYRARAIESTLGNLLDGYFFSADLKMKKDKPEFFAKVSKMLDIPPSEMIFVDNDEKNVEGARAAGLRAELYREGIIQDLTRESTTSEFKIS